ncbi:MAG: tryptophan--tRNA ligase [Actinobacteria bacterium]|nr:tryptophan--tRNA ligase [Actinomycetota bacterium]MBU4450650.1 tryptophan--tRNA ligase [Actinomycetota bacterium]MCG2788649.1 tryptophan--tRNA ligase [Actinomycetes bacterium]
MVAIFDVKKIMLTGFRPTGRLHLGHLHGNIKNMIKNQNDYDNFFFLVDWHALSTEYQNPKNIKTNLLDCVIDLISLGIDPELTHLYRQSDIPEIAELTLYLSVITPLSWLERCPTYKEQIREIKSKDLSTLGFFSYPVLMAADILIVNADIVPVGEDQLPHLEITREIARRFNFLYGNYFKEPAAMLSQATRVPGTDGRKMSKSYDNAIFLSDDFDSIKKKVRSMITDPKRIHLRDPGNPQVCNVFTFYKLYKDSGIEEIENRCKNGQVGCTACKDEIAGLIFDSLKDFQTKRKELENNIGYVYKILEKGKNEVREISKTTILDVRKKMGID